MQTKFQKDGIDMLVARGQMLMAARAAGVQCFDTVFTDLDDNEGFEAEVRQNKAMGFDGKSLINPKQIRLVHQIFAPTEKEVVAGGSDGQRVPRGCGRRVSACSRSTERWLTSPLFPGAERTLKPGEGLRHV